MISLKKYISKSGEELWYIGNPDLNLLEKLSEEEGDIWHSSFDQGLKNAFQDLVYFSAVYWWFHNDFDDLNQCISWRVNLNAFAVRASVFKQLLPPDSDYKTSMMQGFDFGFNALKHSGAVVYYVKGLFPSANDFEEIPAFDRYLFYKKHFKAAHRWYMLLRKGFWKPQEFIGLWKSSNYSSKFQKAKILRPKPLKALTTKPSVAYIIPTMGRQMLTRQLLNDLDNQTYLPSQVIVIDATPHSEWNDEAYNHNFKFELEVYRQQSKGSCRARNEALAKVKTDYIVFGDDDIRIPPNYIENHLKFLETYQVKAAYGLDVRADHQNQNLNDLQQKLDKMPADARWRTGPAYGFNNANSAIHRSCLDLVPGNDINYDGGYGEDKDFGLMLLKKGITVLHNPYAVNLHLKPPLGGYRVWAKQAKTIGKKRKTQPWELDTPVGWIRPIPSPTKMYEFLKHFKGNQLKEYKIKYFIFFLTRRPIWTFPLRLIYLPIRLLQYQKAVFYAKKLLNLGPRYQ